MICIFCKKEMSLSPATIVSGCSKCKIFYSNFNDYYYSYFDKNGLRTNIEATNLGSVIMYTNFNKLKIISM